MAKRNQKKVSKQLVSGTVVVAAFILMGTSFALASGSIAGSDSLLGAALSAVTSKPSVTITKAANSLTGGTSSGKNEKLAAFNITVKNVKWWATVQQVVVNIPITSSALVVSDFSATYSYCIPKGTSYGYGFAGGSCSTKYLKPSIVERNGNTYKLVFGVELPVFPEQGTGTFVISGTPKYTSIPVRDTSLSVNISSGLARGDSCKNITYGINKSRYGYTKCSAVNASVITTYARGNSITVKRPYGYTSPVSPRSATR